MSHSPQLSTLSVKLETRSPSLASSSSIRPEIRSPNQLSTLSIRPEMRSSTWLSTLSMRPEMRSSTRLSTLSMRPEMRSSTWLSTLSMRPEMRSSTRLAPFREVSTLYVKTVEDEGRCLRSINTFLSKELKILGITEIMIGISQVVFGLPLNFEESYIFAVLLGVPWWTGILYIISGSLVVDIINTANPHLKQAVLLMHIISTIAAVFGSGVYLFSLSLMEPLTSSFYLLGPLLMIVFLIVLSILQFLIAFSISFLHCAVLVHDFDRRSLRFLPVSQY